MHSENDIICGFHLSFALKQSPMHGTQFTFHYKCYFQLFIKSSNFENVTVRYPSQDSHGTHLQSAITVQTCFQVHTITRRLIVDSKYHYVSST
jgi:hypothetical protein